MRAALLGKRAKYAPDRSFDTLHVALDLNIDFKRRSLSGRCMTRIRSFKDGLRQLEFDSVGLKFTKATVDGRPARHAIKGDKIIVTAPNSISAGEEAEIEFRYSVIEPKSGVHFVYPGRHNPKNPVQFWTQSQPEDARFWFPCHDAPHEKASSEVRVTVPKGFRAVSNGSLIEESHEGARSSYHWRLSRPHSIYLISIAAGRFSEIVERWEDVPVTYYCEKGREEDAKRGFSKTVKAMDFFSKMTGVRYPYDKYAQVAVAEYPGGMEHTTCTTQTDACLIDRRAGLDTDLDLLVAHELAHQWFGDLVTCRDWSHAWLNEGFATYFEILFQEHDKGRDEADYELHHNARVYFDEDARRYRRPIVCSTFKTPWTLFDRHTYEKGSWVLHMLKSELGDAAWWSVIKHYLEKHRDQSVETPDLVAAITEVTGRNLKPFFDQWVYRAGYPTLRVEYHWDQDKKSASLWVVQTQDCGEDSPAFKLPLRFRFAGRGWTKDFDERLTEKEHRFSWRLPAEPLGLEVDPEHTILKKLALRKPLSFWRHQLLSAAAAQSRYDAARVVASWGDEASVDLLARAARREKFWAAGAEMVRALGTVQTDHAFHALLGLANIAHPKVRRAVAESLGQHQRAFAGPVLARLARRDPSIHVAAEATRALGALGDPKHRALLKSKLRQESYRDAISSGAVAGIAASRGPGALETLRRAAQAPNGFWHRAQAIRSLGEYAGASDRVVPWLCELAGDRDERISLVALSALGSLEDQRALPALRKAKGDANMRVRVYAEEALARVTLGLDSSKRNGKKK